MVITLYSSTVQYIFGKFMLLYSTTSRLYCFKNVSIHSIMRS